jgi:hypothetical protein
VEGFVKITRKRAAVVGTVTVVSGLSVALAAPAMASGNASHLHPSATVKPAFAVSGAHYYRVTPACTPASNGITCYAMERIPVHLRAGQRVPAGVERDTASPSANPGPAGGYSPLDLEGFYNFNRNGGRGQTVGIVLWDNDPEITNDLNAFDAQYGFSPETSSSFRVINENGQAAPLPSTDAGSVGADVEESLDVESVRSACSQCKIVLVEADNPYNADLDKAENAAVAAGADVVSNSWGGPEYDPSSQSPTFDSQDAQAFNHPGVAILASTGDHGWYDWDWFNSYDGTPNTVPPSSSASFPSTLATVVAVGGTSVLNSQGSRIEGVWNENGSDDQTGLQYAASVGATGGGCSQVDAAAGWQSHASGYASTGCQGARLAADISAIADPYTGFDIYDTDSQSGWLTIGGTSLASPFLAGMWARAGGPQGVPYPATTLYANYNKYHSTLHDVVNGVDLINSVLLSRGGNAFCSGDQGSNCAAAVGGNPNTANGLGAWLDCSWNLAGNAIAQTNQCDAAKGFDGPSGIGTPNGLGVFTPRSFAIYVTHPSKIHAKKKGAYKVSLKDPAPGGKAHAATWNWGDGKSSSGLNTSHKYKKPGKYKLTISATDNYGIAEVGTLKLKVVK